jgi:hypothetical protein
MNQSHIAKEYTYLLLLINLVPDNLRVPTFPYFDACQTANSKEMKLRDGQQMVQQHSRPGIHTGVDNVLVPEDFIVS